MPFKLPVTPGNGTTTSWETHACKIGNSWLKSWQGDFHQGAGPVGGRRNSFNESASTHHHRRF